MSRSFYRACDKCGGPVRVDDGSFINHKGEECIHFFEATRNVESTLTVFRSPDGKVSIPWEPNAPCPPGYTTEEIRGAAATRRLEKELDAQDRKRYERYQQKVERLKAPSRERRRQDLQQIIREGCTTVPDGRGGTRTIRVSQFGRDIARQALKRIDQGGYSQRYDPGNYRRE